MTGDCTGGDAPTGLAREVAHKRPQPDASARADDHRQQAIKTLLATADHTVDDKLATVKTAHHVDKDRFQSAFRSLMGKSEP